MASVVMMGMTLLSSEILPTQIFVQRDSQNILKCLNTTSSGFNLNHNDFFKRQSISPFQGTQKRNSRFLFKPLASTGLEASIADSKEGSITLKNAKIVVESQDENTMQVRVDLAGDETQKVFDHVLKNLARSAPPIPGFRRQKGGKTSNVPTSFLLDVLGKERVTKFVIQEIVSSTMADYAEKEKLNVKEKNINTTQSLEELKQRKCWHPGNIPSAYTFSQYFSTMMAMLLLNLVVQDNIASNILSMNLLKMSVYISCTAAYKFQSSCSSSFCWSQKYEYLRYHFLNCTSYSLLCLNFYLQGLDPKNVHSAS